MGELKYREIGIFKNRNRAEAFARDQRMKGKTVRVERQVLPSYGGCSISGVCFSVQEKRRTDVFGKNYRLDTVK